MSQIVVVLLVSTVAAAAHPNARWCRTTVTSRDSCRGRETPSMRIGMFADCYHPTINGVVSSIDTLKTNLERQGHAVTLFYESRRGFALRRRDQVDGPQLIILTPPAPVG